MFFCLCVLSSFAQSRKVAISVEGGPGTADELLVLDMEGPVFHFRDC